MRSHFRPTYGSRDLPDWVGPAVIILFVVGLLVAMLSGAFDGCTAPGCPAGTRQISGYDGDGPVLLCVEM